MAPLSMEIGCHTNLSDGTDADLTNGCSSELDSLSLSIDRCSSHAITMLLTMDALIANACI